MNRNLILAALLSTALSTGAFAQNVNVNDLASQSASGAEANSGSVSGASSDNQNANVQTGNVGVSVNENTSTSSSGAVSGSNSESGSISDQEQGQSQGQSQGQMQELDAAQANSQGVTFNQTWNTKNRKTTEIRTNNAVPLTSSSSFSSDYCGGTVSGGASAAPLGISIGGSKPVFDKSCQSLRRAEKFGMAAVNAMNMKQVDLAGKLMSMMVWSICTSDSDGTEKVHQTAQACDKLLLLGSEASTYSAQPAPAAAPQPQVAYKGKITPEASAKAISQSYAQVTTNDLAAASKPPR